MTRGYYILPLVFPFVLSGCLAEDPLPAPIPNRGDAGGSGYADLVISFSENGIPVACDSAIGAICEEPTGPCADHATIGAPDDIRFELVGQNSVEVGLICNPIIDRSSNSGLANDFQVWATVNTGSAVVSVSDDGSNFTVLQNLTSNDQAFDLSEQGLQFVRFVRITGGSANTSISIDAIEALP